MNEDELYIYEEKLYNSCVDLANDMELQSYWKLVYNKILLPTLQFFQYKSRKLLSEYNPKYERYNKNMYLIAEKVCKRIKKERELLERLNMALDNKFDIERDNYSELICIYTFRKSIYTQVKLELLNGLLCEEY